MIKVIPSFNMTRPGLGILVDCDVAEIIARRTGEQNLSITSWCLEPISDVNGFMGSYWQLNVTVNRHGVHESLAFFAKTPPPPGPQRDFSLRQGLFNKEIVMYNEIVPRMGIGSGAKWSPDCYYCKPDIIIVMENLTLDGYSMLDKYVPFGYEELASLFDTFARFHSRSLILDEQLRQQGKSLHDIWSESLNEGLYVTSDSQSVLFQQASLLGLRTMMNQIQCLEDNQRDLIMTKVTAWWNQFITMLRPSSKYRNVICHRDVWSSNFMLKVDAEGKPINFRMIDFQYYSYQSPAVDLTLAIYLNTNRSIRDNNFDLLMQHYHDQLKQCLNADGFDIKLILPWDVFRQSVEEARPWGLVYTIINQQVTLLDDDVREKYFVNSPEQLEHVLYGTGRAELVSEQFESVPGYREKLTEAIMESLELPELLG